MFRKEDLKLDPDWASNGVSSLRFRTISCRDEGSVRHAVVELEPDAPQNTQMLGSAAQVAPGQQKSCWSLQLPKVAS